MWSRVKTWVWSAFWVSLAFFVDALIGSLSGASLPDIKTDLFGMLPSEAVIPTSVFVGLVLNQISKYIKNVRSGEVYEN